MNKFGFIFLQLAMLTCLVGCPSEETTETAQNNPPQNQEQGKEKATQEEPADDAADEKSQDDPNRVSFDEEGFSFTPPEGWTKSTEKSEQYFVSYMGQRKDNFTVNLNVNTTADDGTSLKAVGDQIKTHYPTQFKGWKLGEEGMTKLNGQDAYFISSKFTMEGYDIQNLQYFIKGTDEAKKFYIVTFTDLEKNYQANKAIFEKSANSIETYKSEK